MREVRYCVSLAPNEYRLMLYALNRFRNKLIGQWRYTDAVDDLMVKIVGKN